MRPTGIWIASAIAVAIPLALDPAGYFVFLPIKSTLAGVLVAAGLAALILERRPLSVSPSVIGWVVLLVVLAASSVLGIGGLTSWIGYPSRSLGVIAWVVFGGAFFLGSSFPEARERRFVLQSASAASIVVSVYALAQAAGIDPIQWSENIDVRRTRSTLGNAALLGAYLAMIVPLAGRLSFSSEEPRRLRWLYIAAAGLGAIALLTTGTRGAWLGAIAGIAMVLLLEFRRLRTSPGWAFGLVGLAVVVVILLATVSPFASRIRSIADPTGGTARGRVLQWGLTMSLIASRPVLGWGPETYAFAFPRYVDAEFERAVGRAVVPDRAHNLFLDMASSSGAVAVATFLVILATLTRAVLVTRERDAFTVAIAGAVAAYLVQLQFSISVPDLDTVFWLLAGLLVATARKRPIVFSPAWAVVPALAGIALLLWGATDIAADRALRRALNAEAAGMFVRAQSLVEQAFDRAPLRVQYLQAAARLNRRAGERSGSEEDFMRGLEIIARARAVTPRDLELAMDRADLLISWGEVAGDPNLIKRAALGYERILVIDQASSRAHLKLGVAYVQVGRIADAETEWRTASSLSPRSPGPLINLGVLYEQEGEKDKARKAFMKALKLDPENAFVRESLRRLNS